MKQLWSATVLILLSLMFFTSCEKHQEEKLLWQHSAVPSPTPLNDIFFVNDSLGFCCGGITGKGVVYKTIDGGKSWDLNHEVNRCNLFGVYFTDEKTGWIAGDTLYLAYTKDGGESWWFYWFRDNVPTHVMNRSRLSSFCFVNDSVGFVCGGWHYNKGIVYRTRDAGKSWEYIFYENEMNAVCFADENNGLLAGYGLMLQSDNGGATYDVMDFDQQYFRGLAHEGSDYLAAAYRGGIFKSQNQGMDWEKEADAPFRIKDMASNDDFIVVAGLNGGLMYRKTGSSEWIHAQEAPDVDFESVCLFENTAWLTTLNGDVYQVILE